MPVKVNSKKNERHLVILADFEKGIFFKVIGGKISEMDFFYNTEVPQKASAGGELAGRTSKRDRHIEDHLFKHLQKMIRELERLSGGFNPRFILIGGHKDMIKKIRSHLRPPLSGLVAGEFISELNIPFDLIIKKSQRLLPV